MLLFHDVLEKFIAPIALYGDYTKPITVTLYVVGSVEPDESYAGLPYEYYSDDCRSSWHNSLFWSELLNLDAWLEHGVLESFWSGSAVVPGTLEIYKNKSGRHIECVLLWGEPNEIEWDECLRVLKYEEPDLYAKVVTFLRTEGVKYGF